MLRSKFRSLSSAAFVLFAIASLARPASALVLNFQFGQNADLENPSVAGANLLATNQVTVSNIAVGDGSTINVTAASAPGNLNSADNGIGVGSSTTSGTGRLGTGESVALSFNRDVVVTGFTLNEVTGTDNCTYSTPNSGGTQTTTSANVTGFSLSLTAGQAITFSTTIGDGIRIGTLTVTPSLQPNYDDQYQVLVSSSNNKLDVLRNDVGTGLTLSSITQPTHGTSSISGANVLYTPTSLYVGTDYFTYTSSNSSGALSTWNVTVDVRRYPNFVFVLADDQGWTGLSVQMDKNRPDSKSDYYRTPRTEILAAEGMRISAAYSPAPNCSPSRCAFLTGKTPARLKFTDIVGRNNNQTANQYKLITPGKAADGIKSADKTTAELLKTIPGANYSAAHFGKWHIGGGGPVNHGFDANANDGATNNLDGDVGPNPINPDPKATYSVTDRALSFLSDRVANGRPFYLQVSYYAVHEEIQTRQSTYDTFNGVPKGTWHTNQYYAGMTADLDINVGRVLDQLDSLGIRNSTYVIYTSDNGAPQAVSENYPLRGYKPEIWEGGDRVPAFVRGPGVLANSQCNVVMSGVDILPTIWEWATGSTANLPIGLDGGSLVPTIRSIALGSNSPVEVVRGGEFVHHGPHYVGPQPWPNDWVQTAKDMRPRSSIHIGNYKLVADYETGKILLYNLTADIGEQSDLSNTELAIQWQLWVHLRDYLKMINAQMPTLDPSYQGTSQGKFVLPAATGSLGDADSDGLNDSWEFRELLTYALSGSEDTDHDGVSNANELTQGTDPLVPNAIRINSITPVGPNQYQLTWNATPGASFVVETSTDLITWVPGQIVPAPNLFEGSVIVNSSMDKEFFRVRKQ